MSAPAFAGRPSWRIAAAGLAACAVLWAGAAALAAWRDRFCPLPTVSSDVLYLQPGPGLPRATLGFNALLADVYWIRAIQHYGDTRRSKNPHKRFTSLFPLLDLTTTLDPRFTVAYRFGAIFLAEPFPDGPGRADQAIALLKRGLEADPKRWQYAQDAGFVYYWWLQDYKTAAAWFDRAASIDGAPWWMRSMAASTLALGGDRGSSRLLWRQLYETSEHEWVRSNAQLKLMQLDALDQMDALASVVRRYAQLTGRTATTWAELGSAGLLGGLPVDPSGVPYRLDPDESGSVGLAKDSPLFPIPSNFVRKPGPTS
jgi:hypothetical protein